MCLAGRVWLGMPAMSAVPSHLGLWGNYASHYIVGDCLEFVEQPLMEDVELSIRLKRLTGGGQVNLLLGQR